MPIYTINKMTFNSADIEKSGSHPSPRHTYRFTSEKGVDFILPCISDSGNARTLVAQDLLEEKSIEYYEADADEHLIAPNGTDMHIQGCHQDFNPTKAKIQNFNESTTVIKMVSCKRCL